MLFDYIIYHKNCLDGFSSYIILTKTNQIAKKAIIYPDNPSSTKVPPDIKDKNIIIMDTAYSPSIIKQILKECKTLYYLDHHITHIDEIRKIKDKKLKVIYDVNKSGASLTWYFFFKNTKYPKFIRYIEDNDLGIWKYEKTMPFITALKVKYKTKPKEKYIREWYKLFDINNVKKIIDLGYIYMEYRKYAVEYSLNNYVIKEFPSKQIASKYKIKGKYSVCVINNNSVLKNEIMKEILNTVECDFVLLWYYLMEQKKYIFMLRSNKKSIQHIAKAFGGGGHEKAAAFSLDNLRNIDDLFT